MGIVIAALGQFWITNSEPYELGRAAVGNRLGMPRETVSLKRIAPFEFVDVRPRRRIGIRRVAVGLLDNITCMLS